MRSHIKLLLYAALVCFDSTFCQQFLSREEALSIHLGPSVIRHTIFLTDLQINDIQKHTKAKVESKILTYYTGGNKFAFFETRTVRTMPTTFLIVINTDGTVQAVEILSFFEPEDYLPPVKWRKTFQGKSFNDDLWLKRGVYNIAGATLSAHVITESVRRIVYTFSHIINTESQ